MVKRLGRAFVSKYSAEPLKRSTEFLKHSVELWRLKGKTESLVVSFKNSAEHLKSSAACLCYNKVHAVPISHGNMKLLWMAPFSPNTTVHSKLKISVLLSAVLEILENIWSFLTFDVSNFKILQQDAARSDLQNRFCKIYEHFPGSLPLGSPL